MMSDVRKILEKEDEKDNILFVQKQFQKFEMLTEKRVQIVKTVIHRQPSSIRELAIFLHRDIKNVFDDVKVLNDMGMIKLIRIGRRQQPVVKRKFIVISFE
jgi:predicted transcriptional regulator